MNAEIVREVPSLEATLEGRQDQFAALIGVGSEQLRGLKFCDSCGGADYEWTDWGISEVDVDGMEIKTMEETVDYRVYLASLRCDPCDATGFKGGNFKLSPGQWVDLSASGTN